MAAPEWRAIIDMWPDRPEYAGRLKMALLNIAALMSRHNLPLGQHPRFISIVKALDRLLMREANADVEDYVRLIMVQQHLGDHGISIDANLEKAIASFVDAGEAGGCDYNCVIVMLGDGQDAPAYFDTFFPEKGTTPSKIMEDVASDEELEVSQLRANVPDEERFRPIEEEVFVLTLAVRPEGNDYQVDIDSWPAGPEKAALLQFLRGLQD